MARQGRSVGIEAKVKALMLAAEGLSANSIAAVLGVTRQAVSQWSHHGLGASEFEARTADGSLPALTDDERAEADRQLARQGGKRTPRAAAESEARTVGAKAGAAVLRLHGGDDEAVGPLVHPVQRQSFAAAAGYGWRLRWALIEAGLDIDEADDWTSRAAIGAPEARGLLNLYERGRSAGGLRRMRSVVDGEGAPATTWQVVLRLDADMLVEVGASGDIDPLADEPDEALLAGLDVATAELREAR
jgi:hypothetical protein